MRWTLGALRLPLGVAVSVGEDTVLAESGGACVEGDGDVGGRGVGGDDEG